MTIRVEQNQSESPKSSPYVEINADEKEEGASAARLAAVVGSSNARDEFHESEHSSSSRSYYTETMDSDEEWKQSPFAIGPSKLTWADEEIGCKECCLGKRPQYVSCSALFCSYLGVGRVGNMVILRQTTEEIEGDSGEATTRPKLVCVLGPYWMFVLCLTLPLISGISIWIGITRIPDQHWAVVLTWALCTAGVYFSLLKVSCTDPGVLHRCAQPPVGEENEWRWNDQAHTYRPWHAKYDKQCGVVIEKFDHT